MAWYSAELGARSAETWAVALPPWQSVQPIRTDGEACIVLLSVDVWQLRHPTDLASTSSWFCFSRRESVESGDCDCAGALELAPWSCLAETLGEFTPTYKDATHNDASTASAQRLLLPAGRILSPRLLTIKTRTGSSRTPKPKLWSYKCCAVPNRERATTRRWSGRCSRSMAADTRCRCPSRCRCYGARLTGTKDARATPFDRTGDSSRWRSHAISA